MVDQSVVDRYKEMDIDELEFELVDICNAIDVEQHRMNQCFYDYDIAKHMENIKHLKEEAAYVRKLMRELMDE